MSDSRGVPPIICIWLTSLLLLLFAGCADDGRREQAVKLYVDAVMLRETDAGEQAIEKLNSAVQLNKRFSLAYSLLGEIYQDIKDYENSAAAYEEAVKLNPWSFKDYFNLGRVYQIMQKFAEAVKAYNRACEIEPEHLEANISNARCYYEIQDFNSALVYLRRAEQIDPNVGQIQKVLGDIYDSQKDYDQAVRSYKRALELDSNNPDVMLSLAVAYLRTGRNEPAKSLLASVTQLQPDNNDAYKYLGYCYLQFYDKATKAYNKAQAANSDDSEVLVSLKEDMRKLLNQSIVSYDRAIEIDDKDWDAHRGLGVAYMLKGMNNKDEALKLKAIEQWRLSLEIKPDQPRREMLLKLVRKYSR